MTEHLYEQDPFLGEFSATVLGCVPGREGWLVTLDRTAFYPEGGGQSADHGLLNEVAVTDVHEKDGVVLHTCAAALPEGATVTGRIDWERRFDHMQQHSGEHLVSGLLHAAFGCDNVGFHLGADTVSIDFNCVLTLEELAPIEAAANALIWQDVPVGSSYPDPQALAALDYRSKKALTGAVRIVTIPGADCCACCGTHVATLGQIGLVKFLSCTKFREGVRIELLCGKRAMDYLGTVWAQNLLVAQSLSAKPTETAAAVSRLQGELTAVKERLAALEEAANEALAARYQGAGAVLRFEQGLSADSLRRQCLAIAAVCGGRCAVFSGDEAGHRYAICQEGGDLRGLTKTLNERLAGRGGGKPQFVQGSVQAGQGEIEALFAEMQW